MERRITRSAAAKEAAQLAAATAASIQAAPPSGIKNKVVLPKKKRKRNTTIAEPDINELPHNLGRALVPAANDTPGSSSATTVKAEETKPVVAKSKIDVIKDELQDTVDKATTTLGAKAQGGKAKINNPYGLTPGVSPFPEWSHPTPEECEEVNKLLSSVHGEVIAPAAIPEPSLTVTGCGEVPSVLDALIRTLLSGATTGNNSAMAFQGLVQKFGILQDGVGKGSVDWDAVRQAPVKDIFEAIKSGGLAELKSKRIKDILNMVYKENMQRRDALLKAKKEGTAEPPGANNENDLQKQIEIDRANEHVLSLNHVHSLSNEDAMLELVKYPGIGPKTAACVILFCLQRPCFAVDTHIFRITKWLGWIPSEKVDEVKAFSHLEVRIPDHLKYSLHQLFIRHGKSCPRCRAITGENSDGWEEGCVIDHLVKRTGKRKGARESAPKAKKSKARGKDDDDESE
ncbi:HhH-GPD family base excision DNA repair protein [Paecilomyces variotii No. 5]|uniref:HhH-GPD family base excision DNA repair protein n=1 Tax=Byssochlamys spectabilis (strain No. 5 / NBRC 109023) TaxID=1356009 RepID=V5F733_BYSSN|nr:HhH-GPD family base excision DNA repair protein [Paecilomyces variotii No. 5]